MSASAKVRLEKQADLSSKIGKTILLSRQKDGTQNKPKGYHRKKKHGGSIEKSEKTKKQHV